MWSSVLVVCLVPVVVVQSAPHIIVIMADDMGWNDVSFHGSNQIMTPNIDALAYQGVILNRHYTQPSCSPSRAAFLTGYYPAHTGVQMPIAAGTTAALPLNFTLLPQHLRKLGYRTALVGKWHLGSHRREYLPTQRGFDSHFGFWNGFQGYFNGLHIEQDTAGIDAWRNETGAWQEFIGHYATDLFIQEAVSIVKTHEPREAPLYLHVALSAPHTGNKGSEFEVRDLEKNERQYSHIADLHRRLYAGMVQGVDEGVGTILKALQEQDMLQHSIVLFTSDNGAPTMDEIWSYNNWGSNWPLRGMKLSTHDGGVRSAAAVWSPLINGGRVSDQLLHITDWTPTLYAAAGGNVNDLGILDGINQWEHLKDQKHETNKRSEMLVNLDLTLESEALVKWPWKVMKYSPQNPSIHVHAGESGRGPEEPEYSVTQVTSSPAAQALSMNRTQAQILSLRKRANIDSSCSQTVGDSSSEQFCSDHYCLFNLEEDPCEVNDVARLHPDTLADLLSSLDNYKHSVISTKFCDLDPRAHPSRWQNYWAVWADNTTGVDATSGADTFRQLGVLFAVLLLLVAT